MIIAVIGSGGREHAIAWKLQQSKIVERVFVMPGNGGTSVNVEIDPNDFPAIKAFCADKGVEMLFVGPEDPLANGIVDYFADTPIKVFGPEKRAAIMESSKIWSKRFMRKHNVATADFWEFNAENSLDAENIIKELDGKCVIKYDGLAAGKGVFVCSDITDATESLLELKAIYGEDANYLIEERLIGRELSLLAFTDGKDYQLLLPSQDHKQLLEGDLGPNTGGMGAFCPVPFYDDEMKQEITRKIVLPTMNGVMSENFNYKGVIYFGVMLTDKGPKLLEYNVRLGDPETEVVLPALKSDLAELVLACFNGTLKDFQIEFNPGFFVDVVLVSGGYPKAYKKGELIEEQGVMNPKTLIFQAGTKKVDGKLVTSGGRVINVVANKSTLDETIAEVYSEVKKISFKDSFYRKDIGTREK